MFKEKVDFWFDEVEKVMTRIIGTKAKGVSKWKNIWMEKKGDLLPYFDENGRIEKEVKLENCTEKELHEVIENFFISNPSKLVATINKRCDDMDLTYSVIDSLRSDLMSFPPMDIVKNRLLSDRGKFPKGMKVSKCLTLEHREKEKTYVTLKNEKKFEIFLDNYNVLFSMLINFLKSMGKIGLSINPMDYILVSAHTNGWKSCHNIEIGCYRTGGISYMLDDTSLVGYAYEKTLPLSESGFNSREEVPLKLWRSMVFLSPQDRNFAIISRQYPSEKAIYSYTMRELVSELMGNICKVPSNYVTKAYNMSPIRATENNDVGHTASVYRNSGYNYVDYITSHVLLSHFENRAELLSIDIGYDGIPCTECGNLRYYDMEDDGSNYLTCEECDDRGYHCYTCGDICSDDYCYNGVYYCESCFDNEFSYCRCCDITVPKDDLHEVLDALGDTTYVCTYCRDRYYIECDRCGTYSECTSTVEVDGYYENWCALCVQDYAYNCRECGELFSELVKVDEKYTHCENCADSKFDTCSICGDYYSTVTTVGDKEYCDDCIEKHCVKCVECGEYTDNPLFNLCEKCVKNKEMAKEMAVM